MKRIVAALVGAAVLALGTLGGTSAARACDPPCCYDKPCCEYKVVTCYETRCVPCTETVTCYDECGHSYCKDVTVYHKACVGRSRRSSRSCRERVRWRGGRPPPLTAAVWRIILPCMNGPTDEQLAETFQNALRQADGAFWHLHERHAPRLLAFLRNRSTPDGDAEDVHQEVWLRVWRNLSGRFHGGNFRAWLYEIARHCRLDWEPQAASSARLAVPFEEGEVALPSEWTRPAPGQIDEEQERREERMSRPAERPA